MSTIDQKGVIVQRFFMPSSGKKVCVFWVVP